MKESLGWLEAARSWKAVWSSAIIIPGALSVTASGITMMLELCADNLDFPQQVCL